ncbi:MAG: hypothetical protein JWP59_2259 [Massilia sp.]|nr:hypothetical protein [Massilia sp.]
MQSGATLWASVASGMAPAVHGVAAALELRPDGGGTHAAGVRSWRSAPVWETLHTAGIASCVIGWPATACATDWQATVIDPRFADASAVVAPEADWPLAPRCIHPADLRESLRELRLHPDELDDHAGAAADPTALAHAASMHAAATYLIESTPWQFAAVHYGPLLAGGGDGAAMLFDAMIARLLVLADAGEHAGGTDIIIVGSDGVLIAAGPGFAAAADLLVHGAGLADIAATILARFGLRQDGAAGRILDGAGHGLLRTIAGAPMMAPPAAGEAADSPALARARLVTMAADAMANGDFAAAAALLAPALRNWPDDHELAFLLAQCLFFQGESQAAQVLGERLTRAWPDRPWGPMLTGAALMQAGDIASAQPHLDSATRLAGDDPAAAQRLGAIALHLGRPQQAEHHYTIALRDPACAAAAHAGLGLAHLARGDNVRGEAELRASLGAAYHAPALHHQLGVLYASQGRWDEAQNALRTALSQQPGNQAAAALLARVSETRELQATVVKAH